MPYQSLHASEAAELEDERAVLDQKRFTRNNRLFSSGVVAAVIVAAAGAAALSFV